MAIYIVQEGTNTKDAIFPHVAQILISLERHRSRRLPQRSVVWILVLLLCVRVGIGGLRANKADERKDAQCRKKT